MIVADVGAEEEASDFETDAVRPWWAAESSHDGPVAGSHRAQFAPYAGHASVCASVVAFYSVAAG